MSDDTIPEAVDASNPADVPSPTAVPVSTDGAPGKDSPGPHGQPPRPRRRRGSRGGRNRRRKPAAVGANGGAPESDIALEDDAHDADDVDLPDPVIGSDDL